MDRCAQTVVIDEVLESISVRLQCRHQLRNIRTAAQVCHGVRTAHLIGTLRQGSGDPGGDGLAGISLSGRQDR